MESPKENARGAGRRLEGSVARRGGEFPGLGSGARDNPIGLCKQCKGTGRRSRKVRGKNFCGHGGIGDWPICSVYASRPGIRPTQQPPCAPARNC